MFILQNGAGATNEAFQSAPSGPQLVVWGTDVIVVQCRTLFTRFIESFTYCDVDGDEKVDGMDKDKPLYIQKLEEVCIKLLANLENSASLCLPVYQLFVESKFKFSLLSLTSLQPKPSCLFWGREEGAKDEEGRKKPYKEKAQQFSLDGFLFQCYLIRGWHIKLYYLKKKVSLAHLSHFWRQENLFGSLTFLILSKRFLVLQKCWHHEHFF